MPNILQKGMSRVLLGFAAKKIGKEEFLRQLEQAWFPHIKKDTDLEDDIGMAKERIRKSGYEFAFEKVGVTDGDLRELLVRIKSAKSPTVIHNEPEVGRNDPCPCGSGKKYKKCCGG